MHHRPARFASLVAVSSLALFAACGRADASPREGEAGEAAARMTPDAGAGAEIRHDGPQSASLKGSVEAVATPAWSLVKHTDGPTRFEDLERGVLMAVTSAEVTRHFVLDEQGLLVAAPKRTLRKGEIRGTWPENAWTVSVRSEERAGTWMRVAKWRGNNRWVPQSIKNPPEMIYADEGRWYEVESDWLGRPGGRGGYLLAFHDYEAETLEFRRVAGKNFSPVSMPWPDDAFGWPREVFEHPSGRMFVFHQGEEGPGVRERAKCRKNCEVVDAKLPELVGEGQFGAFIARDDGQLTVAIKNDWEDVGAPRLLHRDRDGWHLESAPLAGGQIREMVPAPGGAMFAVVALPNVGEQLWHRDAQEQWRFVELPENARAVGDEGLDLALVDDARMWVAVNGRDEHAVYQLPLQLG